MKGLVKTNHGPTTCLKKYHSDPLRLVRKGMFPIVCSGECFALLQIVLLQVTLLKNMFFQPQPPQLHSFLPLGKFLFCGNRWPHHELHGNGFKLCILASAGRCFSKQTRDNHLNNLTLQSEPSHSNDHGGVEQLAVCTNATFILCPKRCALCSHVT